MQLDTNLLFNGPTSPLPCSPGSPFSAKQQRWTGIVQQVQDSSARLTVRRRQSTEAALAAGAVTAGSLQQPANSQPPAAAACRRGSLQHALDSRAASAAAGLGPAHTGSRFMQAGRQPTQVLSPNANLSLRFGSLRQRLREVKRGRQQKEKAVSSSRASSVLTDSTADDSSVAGSEDSSVVEAKLEVLLQQVATDPGRGPALTAAAAGGNRNSSRPAFSAGVGRGVPEPRPSLLSGLLPGRLIGSSSSRQQAAPVPAGPKGLGVTVRRFKPPSSSSSSSFALPTALSHAASSPDLPTAAVTAAAGAQAVTAARASCQLPESAVPLSAAAAAQHCDSSSGSGSNQLCANAVHSAHPPTPATAATVLAAAEAAPVSSPQPLQLPTQLPVVQPSQQQGAAMASGFQGSNSTYSSRRPSLCVLCGPDAARQPVPAAAAVAVAAEPVPGYAAAPAAVAAGGQQQEQATTTAAAPGLTAPASHPGQQPLPLQQQAMPGHPVQQQQQQQQQALPDPSSQQISCAGGAADVFNDADIQRLLQRVAACVGPDSVSTTATATAAADGKQTAKRHSSGCTTGLAVHAASIDGCIASACRAEPLQSAAMPLPEAAAAAAAGEQHAAPSTSAVAAAPAAAAAVAAAAGQQQAGAGTPDARRRPLQRHVSWKADVDVLLCDSSEADSSTAPARHCHHHTPAVVHAAGLTAATAATAAAITETAAAAVAAVSATKVPLLLAETHSGLGCGAGDTAAAYQSGRAQADMAALLQQHPATGRRVGSSCDGAQPRLPLGYQSGAGACRHDSSTGAATTSAAAAAPAAAPAVVVRLSSAALALAANLEQQQQRRQSHGSGEYAQFGSQQRQQQQSQGSLSLTQGPPAAQQMALQGRQHALTLGSETGFAAAAAGPASVAGTADDASSCCGFSELSAMANPVAYADTLRQRMAAHLGPLPSSSTAAAAAGAGVSVADPGLPSSAVNLLERYLDGHQGLKQKAVRLEQNLQQRKQLQQQSDAFEQQRRAFSPLGGLPPGRGGLLQGGNSSNNSGADASHLNVDELRQDLEVVLRRV